MLTPIIIFIFLVPSLLLCLSLWQLKRKFYTEDHRKRDTEVIIIIVIIINFKYENSYSYLITFL